MAARSPARPSRPAIVPTILEELRPELVKAIPASAGLAGLWPWLTWYPWLDCAPDVIFTVVQDCGAGRTVIVDETYTDARWNIGTSLDVTLIASGDTLGYADPGGCGTSSNAPFAEGINLDVRHDVLGVDYYEVEYSTSGAAGPWHRMPPSAAGGFSRSVYMGGTLYQSVPFQASDLGVAGGPRVFETTRHYDAVHGAQNWASPYLNRLMTWVTDATTFSDGVYNLRIRGYNLVGGALVDQGVVGLCAFDEEGTRPEAPASWCRWSAPRPTARWPTSTSSTAIAANPTSRSRRCACTTPAARPSPPVLSRSTATAACSARA